MTELLPLNGTVVAARQPRMTETALELAPDLTAEEWETIGHMLGRANRASSWWIGDWINYGEDAGYVGREQYDHAEVITRLARTTLHVYAHVARRYPVLDRIKDLTFAHHQVVASMDAPDRLRWLELAREERWGKDALRKALPSPATRKINQQARHVALIDAADTFSRIGERWERSMTDALTPPQAKKQLTVLRKAHALLGDVIEAIEYRADTLHTFLGR